MLYEDELFLIYYNECDKRYIQKLISIMEERIPYIVDFFQIKYNGKIIIKLYNNLEEYKNNLQSSFQKDAEESGSTEVRQYQNWMIANTGDGKVNMQSFDLVKTQDDYKNYTEEEFCYNACHEFTHLCQRQIGSENPGWFWEVIATTIGNPECQYETNQGFTLDDLNTSFDKFDGYGAAYKIGKYLFANYDNEYILSLVKDNDKLTKEIPAIIEKVNNKNNQK